MNSRNSKLSNPHRLLLNVSDKIDLKGSHKYVALSYRSIYNTWTNIKKIYKNSKFKKNMEKRTRTHPELLTPKTMKLLRSTKSKITKDGNG